jgi:hypothetical protein
MGGNESNIRSAQIGSQTQGKERWAYRRWAKEVVSDDEGEMGRSTKREASEQKVTS